MYAFDYASDNNFYNSHFLVLSSSPYRARPVAGEGDAKRWGSACVSRGVPKRGWHVNES